MPRIVKLSTANQSIALIAPRLSVGSANVAMTARAGSSSMYIRFVCWLCRITSARSGAATDSGIAMCGRRRSPAQLTHAQIASGHAGHVKSGRFFAAYASTVVGGPEKRIRLPCSHWLKNQFASSGNAMYAASGQIANTATASGSPIAGSCTQRISGVTR